MREGAEIFEIHAENVGRRMETVLRQLCQDVPRATLMKWMRRGQVRLNRGRCTQGTRVALGDCVQLPRGSLDAGVRPPSRPPRRLPTLDVAFEDESLIVVDKPAHLACHAGTGQGDDSVVARVAQHMAAQRGLMGPGNRVGQAESDPPGSLRSTPGLRPGLVQRLDRGVSGLLPVGKHAVALRALASQALAHRLEKTYVALVWGQVAPESGRITWPLHVGNQPMGNIPRVWVAPGGKPALTLYWVLARFQRATLLALRLRTGRTHQIRAHLLALGHRICGDPRYGDAAGNAALHQTYGLARPFLHAVHLQLDHPTQTRRLAFTAPPPHDLVRAFAMCRAEVPLETLCASASGRP